MTRSPGLDSLAAVVVDSCPDSGAGRGIVADL